MRPLRAECCGCETVGTETIKEAIPLEEDLFFQFERRYKLTCFHRTKIVLIESELGHTAQKFGHGHYLVERHEGISL